MRARRLCAEYSQPAALYLQQAIDMYEELDAAHGVSDLDPQPQNTGGVDLNLSLYSERYGQAGAGHSTSTSASTIPQINVLLLDGSPDNID